MNIIKNGSGGVIVWENDFWKSGLGPQGSFSLTQYLTQTDANGFLSLSGVDPFINYGTFRAGLAPGSNSTNSGSLAGVITALVFKDNTVTYGVDAGGKIQSIDVSSNTISTAVPFPHTITGTSPVGQDGILYRHNSGGTTTQKTSMFFSYYNNANWNVGAYVDVTSGSFDDTFMTVTATSTMSTTDSQDTNQRTQPHPMEIGQDDVLYIGSGRYVHAYDGAVGANGTFSARVLTLPAGFQITAMKKFQSLFLIVGNYYATSAASGVGEAQLYTWNYTDSDIGSVIPLEDWYVSSIFSWKGSPAVLTQGVPSRNGKNKVKIISGSTVSEAASFDGTLPINRGVTVINDIVYLNAGGKVLSIGDRYKKSTAINNIFNLSASGTTGMLAYADIISGFVASAGSTPAFNTIYINNGSGTASAKTFFIDPNFPYGKKGRVKSVIVKYYDVLAAAGTNGALTLNLNVDNNTSQTLIINGLSTITAPLTKRYTLSTTDGVLPEFNTIGCSASWSSGTTGSPIISKIEIEYELIDIKA